MLRDEVEEVGKGRREAEVDRRRGLEEVEEGKEEEEVGEEK